jgi:hypothetical protein
MKINTALSTLLAIVTMTGCATLEMDYTHQDGWRPGTVTNVGSGQEMLERLSNTCSKSEKSNYYAMIRYTGNSHLRWRSFPIPEGIVVKADDQVDLNVNECKFTVKK